MDVPICLPYLKKDDLYLTEKPYNTDFAVGHIPGADESNHRFDYQNLLITDAQSSRRNFNLDRHGFCFLQGTTSVTPNTADDDEYIKEVYFPEIERILHKALPGYERIDYLDHLVRIRDESFPKKPGSITAAAQPAALPHSDFSRHGGFLAMEQFFPGQKKYFENRDFDLINVWRVLRGPNNDWPLAVCDYESIDMKEDTIECDVIHEQSVGENTLLFKNPKHKWYYLSRQGIDDLIVFRNMSSKDQRPAAFHAAFDTNMETPYPRHSLELRVVAFRPGGEPYEVDATVPE
ncbi:uncharacterized protein F4822DRAFT_388518 [Hypoxylon trugodes]|uniref:uncharacterized protein n=1 Tax=Hypoxylon trugodes TaxID=326681 RepID=UPI002197C355|nr:uncharacterized protein F4822DRAFT_388518 [Hypoxylon trugodes]KAI1391820.1 hypothetical protein F4822DRAFT_388518 [Hypoxylon trugodes]